MKIDKIRKLILEEKGVKILTGQQGQQWIGGRSWMVRVDDGLRLSADSVKGLFDLSVEQMDKLNILEAPLELCPLYPVMRRDINQMRVGPLNIDNYGGVEMLIFGGAVYLLERKYIRAAVSREDYKEFMLAWDKDDQPLIIVNDGMIFAGVAQPMPRDTCGMLIEQMKFLTTLLPSGSDHEKKDATLKSEPETGKQLNMDDFRAEGDEQHG